MYFVISSFCMYYVLWWQAGRAPAICDLFVDLLANKMKLQ